MVTKGQGDFIIFTAFVMAILSAPLLLQGHYLLNVFVFIGMNFISMNIIGPNLVSLEVLF